jgi:hypothetical protein
MPCCAATALRSVLAHNFVWLTDEPFAAAFFARVAPHLPPELAGAPAHPRRDRVCLHVCASLRCVRRAAPLRTYGLRRRGDARRPQRAVAAVPLCPRRALPAARRRRAAGEVRHSPGGVGDARTCNDAPREPATTQRVKLQRVDLQRCLRRARTGRIDRSQGRRWSTRNCGGRRTSPCGCARARRGSCCAACR